jgi:hypothetical protein
MMNDLMPGITYPANGRRVYKESWDYEQEQKARSLARRLMDFLTSGIQSGGDITIAGPGTITVHPTVAYDEDGRRIEITVDTPFNLPAGTSLIAVRHAFISAPGHAPDMHGTIVEHRSDSCEIVARAVLLPGDVPLRNVTNAGGTVTLGTDLRQKRNLSINGDAIIAGSLRVLGAVTSIETQNQNVKDSITTLNSGEPGPGVTGRYSGFEIDRGAGQSKARLLFDEDADRFVAGIEGGESPIVRDADLTYIRASLPAGGNQPVYMKRDPAGGNYLYWSDAPGGPWRPFA